MNGAAAVSDGRPDSADEGLSSRWSGAAHSGDAFTVRSAGGPRRAALAGVVYACGHDPETTAARAAASTSDAGVVNTLACRAPTAPPSFLLTDAFGGLAFNSPTIMARSGSTYFVGEQNGVVKRVTRDATTGTWMSEVYLDISDLIVPSSMDDGGLIGLTTSPDFATTGEIFITYTGKSQVSITRTVIARVHSRPGTNSGDRSTMEEVLSIERGQHDGHNGGKLVFGPDRLLYVAIGDGWYGDPEHRAQDITQIFGKLLRIDVLHAHPYTIPTDNPFYTTGRPEVWAYGFRNPWSFNIDSTGQIWLGDVGQDHWEEVDVVTKGGNYGWSVREGKHCYDTSPCDVPGAIDPVWDYPHVDGYAVTGGYVYAGQNPALKGLYLFGDYISGRLWSLDASNPGGADAKTVIDTGALISGFGEDENGELLIIDWGGGHISRLDPNPAAGAAQPASLVSLGCISPTDPSTMDASLVPYDVIAPLWSDGLDKKRWVKTPAGTSFHVADDGSLQAPNGTILMKEFSSNGKRIETRMLTKDATYGWQFFAFAWNDAQTDATLLTDGQSATLPDGSTWEIPSRAQCASCHRREAGNVLGFMTIQLNESDQLTRLSAAGLFDKPLVPAENPAFTNPYDTTQPVDARARSYLHANCSHCHNWGLMDLQAWTPLASMGILCVQTSFSGGTSDTAAQGIIANPADPASSLIVQRMKGEDGDRMPPLGTAKVDDAGVDLITQWIGGLGPCPATTTAASTNP